MCPGSAVTTPRVIHAIGQANARHVFLIFVVSVEMSSGGDKPADTQPSTSSSKSAADKAAETNKELVSKNAGDVVEAKPSSSDDEYIRLRVITSDLTNEVHFRVKSATSLGRLKRSYCSKLGHQVDELRFVFDGHRITDDDTPKSLNMENDDVIEIYQERTGGM